MAKKKKSGGRRRLSRGKSKKSTPAAPKADEVDAGPAPRAPNREELLAHYRMLADVATSMWYLKTKHFRASWSDEDPDIDDPRERRALGRLAKGIQALADGGIEVQDPTGHRYPEGGEAMMKPVQMVPTDGIDASTVTETLRPIVFFADRLIQRGEVLVATPIQRPEED